MLNHLGENKIDIIKTLSSLPSSYTLNWLAEDTFNAMRERLGAGDFAIQDYPSKDRADPYNPPDPDRNGKVRYATHLGFSIDELKLGRDVCKQLAAELPDDLAKKFFNIRGVQTGFDLENSPQTDDLRHKLAAHRSKFRPEETGTHRSRTILVRATRFYRLGRHIWSHCPATTAKP